MPTVVKKKATKKRRRANYDGPWKNVLDRYLAFFLKLALPRLAREIDWNRPYELLDKELTAIAPEHATGSRIVDKLIKLWLKNGKEVWILLHAEIQAQPDNDVPERMFIYRYRLFDKYRRPVISLAILADNDPNWRPGRYEETPYPHKEFALKFKYRVIKILDFESRRAQLEKSKNPFAVLILSHLEALKTNPNDQNRYDSKFQLIRRLYKIGLGQSDILNLYKFIDEVLPLSEPLGLKFQDDIRDFEGKENMPYITSAERIGIKKGRKEGREEGREEGHKAGIGDAFKVFALLKKGMSLEEIQEQVSLSTEEIQEIKAELDKT